MMATRERDSTSSLLIFIKATLLGGILFLLPIAALSIVLGHAMKFAARVVTPLFKYVPATFAGASVVTFAAVFALIAVSLLAGLYARSPSGRAMVSWLENTLLGRLPQYRMVKSMAEGFTQIESEENVTPALIWIEEGWQLGYHIETLDSGWVVAFLPQSPTPMSGNILYLPSARLRTLDMSMMQAMAIVKRMGTGSREALAGNKLEIS